LRRAVASLLLLVRAEPWLVQQHYIADYLRILDRARGDRGAAALDARADAQRRWCADIERRMARTVWATGGCVSWYLSAAGRNPMLWPGSTLRFRRATRRVDVAEYDVITAASTWWSPTPGSPSAARSRTPTRPRSTASSR